MKNGSRGEGLGTQREEQCGNKKDLKGERRSGSHFLFLLGKTLKLMGKKAYFIEALLVQVRPSLLAGKGRFLVNLRISSSSPKQQHEKLGRLCIRKLF
jgi:hypothetical protein